MSSETVPAGTVPLATEEGTQQKLSKQIKRAADQVALERNCQLIDSFIQTKWQDAAEA
jgi:hypothetical protein